jgi:microsomal dipeptidase-like Zn-dependent dipeptidase
MNIGRSIKIAQEIKGISNVVIALDFDVHVQQVSRWRNASDVKISLASKLADYFDMRLEDFVSLANDPD